MITMMMMVILIVLIIILEGSNKMMEIDIWIPKLSLGIEYQGKFQS